MLITGWQHRSTLFYVAESAIGGGGLGLFVSRPVQQPIGLLYNNTGNNIIRHCRKHHEEAEQKDELIYRYAHDIEVMNLDHLCRVPLPGDAKYNNTVYIFDQKPAQISLNQNITYQSCDIYGCDAPGVICIPSPQHCMAQRANDLAFEHGMSRQQYKTKTKGLMHVDSESNQGSLIKVVMSDANDDDSQISMMLYFEHGLVVGEVGCSYGVGYWDI
jgi:hypothetical protein